MFDIGFSELLLIAIVALVVIGPKDLPVVVKHIAGLLRELRSLYTGVRHQMHQVIDEAGIADFKNEMTTIIDLEGKPQKAYDVRELEQISANMLNRDATHVPSPLRGGSGRGVSESAEPNPRPPTQPSSARGEGFSTLPVNKEYAGGGPKSEHDPKARGKFDSDD